MNFSLLSHIWSIISALSLWDPLEALLNPILDDDMPLNRAQGVTP